MEAAEDLSELLANDLVELSVAARKQDLRGVSRFFAEELTGTPFPGGTPALEPEVKWIHSRRWPLEESPRSLVRAEFLDAWVGFFEQFADLDDVRFKVKEARFNSGSSGVARVHFFIVARNQAEQREWVQGWASVEVVSSESSSSSVSQRWLIRAFRLEEVRSTVSERDLFSEVAVPAGVAVTVPSYGSPENSGFVWHGAAAADVNRDGALDVFATGASKNYLYLNDGNGRFHDRAGEAGIEFLLGEGAAPLFLDYDNDGDQDLFISSVGDQMLFENRLEPEGRLEFEDVSAEAGVAVPATGFSAVAGDVNGDGLMDIYVASYNRYGAIMPNAWHQATNGTPNLLFVNKGDGRFGEEAKRYGVADTRWSYAAAFVDFDGDSDQDLYVANDFGENGLFLNDGGRFRDVAAERGVLDPGNGMGVSFGDFDNDGDLDLHVTNMSSTAGRRILGRLFPQSSSEGDLLQKLAAGNSLYENLGDGSFENVSSTAGGLSAGWAWGGGFIDFDNDGWSDLYTPNGFISGKSMKDT